MFSLYLKLLLENYEKIQPKQALILIKYLENHRKQFDKLPRAWHQYLKQEMIQLPFHNVDKLHEEYSKYEVVNSVFFTRNELMNDYFQIKLSNLAL